MSVVKELQSSLEKYYYIDSRISDIFVRHHVADDIYKNCYVIYYKFNGEGQNVFVDSRACNESELADYAIRLLNNSIINNDGRLLAYQLRNL